MNRSRIHRANRPWRPFPWPLGRGRALPHVLRAALQIALIPLALVIALVVAAIIPLLRIKDKRGVRFD